MSMTRPSAAEVICARSGTCSVAMAASARASSAPSRTIRRRSISASSSGSAGRGCQIVESLASVG